MRANAMANSTGMYHNTGRNRMHSADGGNDEEKRQSATAFKKRRSRGKRRRKETAFKKRKRARPVRTTVQQVKACFRTCCERSSNTISPGQSRNTRVPAEAVHELFGTLATEAVKHLQGGDRDKASCVAAEVSKFAKYLRNHYKGDTDLDVDRLMTLEGITGSKTMIGLVNIWLISQSRKAKIRKKSKSDPAERLSPYVRFGGLPKFDVDGEMNEVEGGQISQSRTEHTTTVNDDEVPGSEHIQTLEEGEVGVGAEGPEAAETGVNKQARQVQLELAASQMERQDGEGSAAQRTASVQEGASDIYSANDTEETMDLQMESYEEQEDRAGNTEHSLNFEAIAFPSLSDTTSGEGGENNGQSLGRDDEDMPAAVQEAVAEDQQRSHDPYSFSLFIH
jgi:hypothetical protein